VREPRPAALDARLAELSGLILSEWRSRAGDAFVVVECGDAYTQAAIDPDSAWVEAVGPAVHATDEAGRRYLSAEGFDLSAEPNYALRVPLRTEADARTLARVLLSALAAGYGIEDPRQVRFKTA